MAMREPSSSFSLGLISTVGFDMVATPILAASALYQDLSGVDYYRHQLLIFPEGRAWNHEWINGEVRQRPVSEIEALAINAGRGITTFNNSAHDQGYI